MDEEASQRMIRAIIGWAVGMVGTQAVLGGIFWALFYSVDLANLSFIIPLRIWYQDT